MYIFQFSILLYFSSNSIEIFIFFVFSLELECTYDFTLNKQKPINYHRELSRKKYFFNYIFSDISLLLCCEFLNSRQLAKCVSNRIYISQISLKEQNLLPSMLLGAYLALCASQTQQRYISPRIKPAFSNASLFILLLNLHIFWWHKSFISSFPRYESYYQNFRSHESYLYFHFFLLLKH